MARVPAVEPRSFSTSTGCLARVGPSLPSLGVLICKMESSRLLPGMRSRRDTEPAGLTVPYGQVALAESP